MHEPFNIFGHSHTVAWWIILLCHAAIALGTMFGGWRIVKTMGSGITRLQPVGGFCAETAAADDHHRRHASGHPDLHHARHHRLDPRRRHHQRRAVRPLDLGPTHRDGLGSDAPLLARSWRGSTYLVMHLTVRTGARCIRIAGH